MGLIEAILEGSSLVKYAKDKAVAEATPAAEGRGEERGRVEEARDLLRRLLRSKFPGLELLPGIDQINDVVVLESILVDHVGASNDRAQAEKAIRDATAST